MIPPDAPFGNKPPQCIWICRARGEGIDCVHDAVWKLAKSSPMTAQWSPAMFYPYIMTASEGAALHAKAMFLAVSGSATAAKKMAGAEIAVPTMEGIVGFAALSAIMIGGDGESTLENMAVNPTCQRRGIGRRLLMAGLLWCRAHAAGRVFLEVRASNRAAIALYERAGFSVVGNRPGYYSEPPEDGLQMQKSLSRSPQRVEF